MQIAAVEGIARTARIHDIDPRRRRHQHATDQTAFGAQLDHDLAALTRAPAGRGVGGIIRLAHFDLVRQGRQADVAQCDRPVAPGPRSRGVAPQARPIIAVEGDPAAPCLHPFAQRQQRLTAGIGQDRKRDQRKIEQVRLGGCINHGAAFGQVEHRPRRRFAAPIMEAALAGLIRLDRIEAGGPAWSADQQAGIDPFRFPSLAQILAHRIGADRAGKAHLVTRTGQVDRGVDDIATIAQVPAIAAAPAQFQHCLADDGDSRVACHVILSD